MLFTRNQVLLAKTETTKGVDATPDGTNAIKCDVVNPNVAGKEIVIPAVRSSISAVAKKFVNKTVSFSIPVAVKASGAAGTAPEISPLLKACAMTEAIATDTSVTYKPTNSDSNMSSCTIYLYKDGLLIKAVGCVGNMKFQGVAGEYALFTFEMEGIFTSATDASNPTPTYDSTDPVEVKSAGFSFGTWSDAVARSFHFETGNNIKQRPNVNAADGLAANVITSRDPSYSATIEAVLEATNSFWGDFKNRDKVALDFAVGSVAGNKVSFSMPKANFNPPTFNDEDSLQMYELSGQLLEDSSEDNFTIVFE